MTIDYQAADEARLMSELSFVLGDLVREYRKLLGLAKRYPGALPLNVTIGGLEKKADAGQAKLDNLSRRQRGMRTFW